MCTPQPAAGKRSWSTRSLFLRIFFSLSVALVSVSLAVVLAAVGTGLRLRLPLFARSFLGDELSASAASVLALYETGGVQALTRYVTELRKINGIEAWLILPTQQDFLGREIPGLVRRISARVTEPGVPIAEIHGLQLAAAVKLPYKGQAITVAFARRVNTQLRSRVILPEVGFRYMAGLLAAIVFSYVLSRLIARPIENLRLAMRSYAGGSTAVPIPVRLLSRKDELGDLAREFDDMRLRIERLLERQQQLIADISHELRSPLTRLAVAIEIALDSSDREPELLERMNQEVSNLERLIQQLLRLAALESEKGSRNNRPVSLTDILATVIENAEFEGEAAQKKVVYQPAANLTVIGDESLLASAFENILRNAIRYTPAVAHVDVSTLCEDSTVVVRFRDYGPGVPVDALPDLFRPFFRVGTARDRDSGGAGLGLSIAQRSVLVCGGSISARNHEEGGLVVDVRLNIANR